MKKHLNQLFTALIACAVAAASLPAANVLAGETFNSNTASQSWGDDIASMLDGRDYVEGQVLAVFDSTVSQGEVLSTLSDDEESEELGTLSDDAVEETIDVDLNDSGDGTVIRLIKSSDKSTEELLHELASNRNVIYAEPDYISTIADIADAYDNADIVETAEDTANNDDAQPVDADEEKTDAENDETASESVVKKLTVEGTSVDLIDEQGYESIGDLTNVQWGFTNDGSSAYSIHVPEWNKTGETNTDGETPVVGIIDTGIDYTHPEFDGLIVDLSKYFDKAGEYGYNSSGEGDPKDPMDEQGHGTHCAGIMAAKWDGIGTSGAASGAQIAVVKVDASDGSMSDSSIIRGYMCLAEAVKNGLNLKSINCSFGADYVGNTELMMVNELGKLGVITCFASGNSAFDNDEMTESSSAFQVSPYTIIVNAENGLGELVDFSCYGESTTDLLSPGCAILSTTCTEEAQYMASVDKNRLSYDGFTGSSSESGVKVSFLGIYDITETPTITFESKEEFLNIINSAEPAGQVVADDNSFDNDGYSYEVEVPALTESTQRACYLVAMPIDEENVQNLTGFSMAIKSPFNQTNVWSRVFVVEDSEDGSFSGGADIASYDGWIAAADTWSNEPLDLTSDPEDDIAYPYYNGCLYFIAEVQDDEGTGTTGKMYIDSVGAGYSMLRYIFMDGTSMATPAITGSTAVVYSQLEADGTLDGMTAAEKAEYVADVVKAKTVQRENLKSTCTSEGAFDFSVTEENYTPVIKSFEALNDRTAVISGTFLGNETGSLAIDGQSCSIISWTASKIAFELPDDLENGRYSIKLTASNGKTAARKVIVDIAQTSGRTSFEGSIELPGEIKGCKLQLTALDGILYAFPETLTGDYENTAIWNTMWAYDQETGEWKKCADIPASEQAVSGTDNNFYINVNSYGEFVTAEIGYTVETTDDEIECEHEFYLYYPIKDTWTQLDFSDFPDLPTDGNVCGCDAGLFYFGKEDDEDSSDNEETEVNEDTEDGEETADDSEEEEAEEFPIYKIIFDANQVKNGAGSVKVTDFTESGSCHIPGFGVGIFSSCGNEIFIDCSKCIWLKWSEADQKFYAEEQIIDDMVGGDGEPTSFKAQFGSVITPAGVVIAALNGDAYNDRGYDTFYLSEDGTRTPLDRVASMADLYLPSAAYSDGILYVWGDSYYGDDITEGTLVYTSLNISSKADEVESLIDEIGNVEYTDVCKAKIDAARAAYDALTDGQKAKVKNYKVLTDAETEYAELKAEAEKSNDQPGENPSDQPSGKPAGNSEIKTGDSDTLIFWFIGLAAAACAGYAIAVKRKRS